MTTDSITIHAPIAKGYEQILTAVVFGIHSFWRCLREPLAFTRPAPSVNWQNRLPRCQ